MTAARRIVALLALAVATAWAVPVGAQSWRTVTMSRQLGDEGDLDVSVRYASGEFRLRPTDTGVLYRMQLRYDEDVFTPLGEYRPGQLVLGVRAEGNVRVRGNREAGELDLLLARGVPMNLRLELGAVRADLDLGGLALTDLRIETGASESRIDVSRPNPTSMERVQLEVGAADFTVRGLANLDARRVDVSCGFGDVTLDFTGEWRRDLTVDVDMGLGAVSLRFPEAVGIRLEKSGFLLSLDADDLVERDGVYYSDNWEGAARRVTVHVSGGLGSVSIDRVR